MANHIFGFYPLIGYCRYSTDLAKQLILSLHNVLTSCGSVRISFSRRTPEKVTHSPSIILLSRDAQLIVSWAFC